MNAIFLFLLVAGSALLIVSLINRQQMRARLITQKLSQMRRRVSELEELVAAIEPLVESLSIPRLINQDLIDLIQHMINLKPDSQAYLSSSLTTAQQQANELADEGKPREIYRLQESDAAIARNQYYLNEAAVIIRRLQAKGKIELAEMEVFIQELSWSHLMVNVISHIGQGHKALNRGDVITAYHFYRKSQSLLMESTHPDNRRHRMIKEITDILSNRTKTISIDLMPETLHNPSANAANLVEPDNDKAQDAAS